MKGGVMSNAVSAVYGSYGPRLASQASVLLPSVQKLTMVFSRIDTKGRGSISRSQFIRAFGNMNPAAGFRQLGAEGVFAALDTQRTGAVSQLSFIRGTTRLMAQFQATIPSSS